MVKKICVCNGPTCSVTGAESILSNLSELKHNHSGEFAVEICGCLGHCHNAPNVVVDGEIIENVQLGNVENGLLHGQGKKAKKLEDYDADEIIKDDFLNDI